MTIYFIRASQAVIWAGSPNIVLEFLTSLYGRYPSLEKPFCYSNDEVWFGISSFHISFFFSLLEWLAPATDYLFNFNLFLLAFLLLALLQKAISPFLRAELRRFKGQTLKEYYANCNWRSMKDDEF